MLLAGDFAYKIKKPVSLGFVDFSTLESRRFFCEERRLAAVEPLSAEERAEALAVETAGGSVPEAAIRLVAQRLGIEPAWARVGAPMDQTAGLPSRIW